jgi:hypothetical protein
VATEQTVKQVRELVAAITQDSIDNLVTNKDWGRINFEVARKNLELIFGIATPLATLPLELLPDPDINAIRDALLTIATSIGSMRSFTIEQGNATGQRDSISNSIRDQAANLYAQTQIRVPFLAFQRADVRQNEAIFAQAVADARNLLDTAKAQSQASLEEIAGIITAAREAAASVGVAHYTTDFTGEAERLEEAATRWLRTTAGFGAITIATALAFPFVYKVTEIGNQLQAVQVYTSKLVALGILFTATLWCGRLYKAAKHQAMVNRHRSNALKTFQAFVKSSSDDQTRNAVLLEATRSIFALSASGYLDGVENQGGDGAIKVLEVIKSATTAAKPP